MLTRVMLKLSGEALAGDHHTGLDEGTVRQIATQVKRLVDGGVQVAISLGGGNFWRGAKNNQIDRTKSDQIGMLATIMNSIFVSEIFRSEGMQTEIFTPFVCSSFTTLFSKDAAVAALERGVVTFCAGGTGHPYFSSDTSTVLRAIEIEADALLLAKAIDGIYDDDPAVNPSAKKYDTISLADVVTNNLRAMDLTASVMALDNQMPLKVFKLNEPNSIIKAAQLEPGFSGTEVTV